MAAKRKVFVHVGLDDGSGDFINAALETHSRALAELGVRRLVESGEEMFRAAIEILRAHHEWGYHRREVEGAWTDIVRRALKGRDTLVVSQALLGSARPEQVALLVDALDGFEVHVVITVRAPDAWTVPGDDAHDLGSVLDRWSLAVRDPQRLHVIIAGDRAATWKAFGRVVGFGTTSLRVGDVDAAAKPRPPHLALASRAHVLRALGHSWAELLGASELDVVGDASDLIPDVDAVDSPEQVITTAQHALIRALREVERLTRRNESLELRLDKVEKKRKKLKRRLSEVA